MWAVLRLFRLTFAPSKKVYGGCANGKATIIIIQTMKQDIHPKQFRTVVFKDMSNESMFLTRSTAATSETITYEDGNEYPLIKVEISNTSHPFYTGKNMFVDTAGRIERYKNRYAKKTPQAAAPAAAPAATEEAGS